jgi:hypothetical protein
MLASLLKRLESYREQSGTFVSTDFHNHLHGLWLGREAFQLCCHVTGPSAQVVSATRLGAAPVPEHALHSTARAAAGLALAAFLPQ